MTNDGERLARVETKVDALMSEVTTLRARIHSLANNVSVLLARLEVEKEQRNDGRANREIKVQLGALIVAASSVVIGTRIFF